MQRESCCQNRVSPASISPRPQSQRNLLRRAERVCGVATRGGAGGEAAGRGLRGDAGADVGDGAAGGGQGGVYALDAVAGDEVGRDVGGGREQRLAIAGDGGGGDDALLVERAPRVGEGGGQRL